MAVGGKKRGSAAGLVELLAPKPKGAGSGAKGGKPKDDGSEFIGGGRQGRAPIVKDPSKTQASIKRRQVVGPEQLEDMKRRAAGGDQAAKEALRSLQEDAEGNLTQSVTFQREPGGTSFAQKTREAAETGLEGLAGGSQIDRTQVDFGQLLGLGARGSQNQALALQQQAALGQVPSAAEIQGRQQLDQAIAQQFALGQSAGGTAGQQLAAQRGASQQAAIPSQQGVAQAAALRAQEQATARAQFGAQAGQIRAADLGQTGLEAGLAQQQAGLTQQGGLGLLNALQGQSALNVQAQTSTGQFNLAQQQQQLEELKQKQGFGTAIAGAALGGLGGALTGGGLLG